MSINTNYQHLLCYRNLTPEHQTCLDKLIDSYGEKLNAPVKVGNSLFTLHDFNHHCYGLYRIISNHLCNLSVEGSPDHLNEHELFLLDISVLFHDISMSSQLKFHIDRSRHSELSAEMLLNEWGDHSSPLFQAGQRVNLSINDIRAVAEIVKAHSDIKGPDAPKDNGIYAKTLRETMPSSAPVPVRAKLLAGILRLADELDVTVERLGDDSLAEQLDPDDPDEKASKDHWDALHYFSCICNDPSQPATLNLVVDDSTVSQKIASGDRETVLDAVWNVAKKIWRELSAIQEEIFQKTLDSRAIIRMDSIAVVSTLDEVNKYQKKAHFGVSILEKEQAEDIPPVSSEPTSEPSTGTHTDERPSSCPQILSGDVKKSIDNFIITRHLVESGHFLMNQKYCARDWVNTLRLLEDQDLSESCIQVIAQHIRQQTQALESTIILGLDLCGTLLGARIAAVLRYPFAFLIPFQKIETSSTPDKITDIKKFDHAIFVTDAIVTGATLNELMEHYHLQDKLLGIYTLLYRQPVDAVADATIQCPHPVYCISDTFKIEVMEKKNCQWASKVGCIASNQVVR